MRKEEEKGGKKNKKKKKNTNAESTTTSAPPPPASTAGAGPPASKEWTPSKYGGYTPPASGGGGGQVLIKSVNGKVVITPVPGTGNNPPLTSASATTVSVPASPTVNGRLPQAPAVATSPALTNGFGSITSPTQGIIQVNKMDWVKIIKVTAHKDTYREIK